MHASMGGWNRSSQALLQATRQQLAALTLATIA